MRAAGVNAYGGPEQLTLLDHPRAEIDEHGILIHVKAAGVGPWDAKMRAGAFGTDHEMPLVLGVEVAGVVERAGAKVEGFPVGEDVYAYLTHPGGYAEFACEHNQFVAKMPFTLNYVRAAALPVAATTADTAITDALVLAEGESILIAGAAGGVGTIAVQLARLAGAHVIGTGSAESEEYVRALGAHEYIDYTKGDVAAQVRALHPGGVDAALDAVGGDNVRATIKAVRAGGKIVELTGTDPQGDPSIEVHQFSAQPNGARLEKIAHLVDAGKLKVTVERTFPLEQAREAHEMIEKRHVRGKIVLTI